MDRRWLVAAGVAVVAGVVALVFALSGEEDKGSPLNDALGYLPEDTPAAVAISTNLDSDSYEDLDAALQRFGVEGGIDSFLGYLGDGEGSDRVRSLLGNDLVIGLPAGASLNDEGESGDLVAAIRTSDGDDVRQLLEGFGLSAQDEVEGATVFVYEGEEGFDEEGYEGESVGGEAAVALDDDTLIASESRATLEDALRQRADDERLTEDTFEDRLGDLPDDGLIRATGDVPALLDATGVEQFSSVPWVDSLQSFGLSLVVDDRTLSVDAEVRGDEVSEDELPLVPGPESPRVLGGDASFATLDQSKTLSFALETLKTALPQATLDAGIKRFETKLNGSVPALLDQFGEGLVADIDRGRGEEPESVSRSVVKDPAAVANALRALKDEVPRLVQLSSVGSYSDAFEAARIVIPALPLPEDNFPFAEGSTVEAVPGEADLYRLVSTIRIPEISGPGPVPAPERAEFYFGLLGDVFVTAPSLEGARDAASLELTAHDGPPGSVVGSLPLRPSDLDLPAPEAVDTVVTTVQIGLETSTTGLTLRLEASL